jgi:serine/threonine protein kinase/thioredoxin-like negative regulator of GroEL
MTDFRDALREGLLESYKPTALADTVCTVCNCTASPMSLHLLEGTVPEEGPLPQPFVAMAQSRGVIRGSFPVCTNCASLCPKCGIAIQTKSVREAEKVLSLSAWEGAHVSLGNGYCRHANLLRRLGQKGLPASFVSPFDQGTARKRTPKNAGSSERISAATRRVSREHGIYGAGDIIAGKYRVERVMEGGLGRIFVVSEGGETFVLKTLQEGKGNPDAFLDEARCWIGVGRHDNIVPAFWVDRIAGMLCIAAEYIPPDENGRTTLRDVLLHGKPSLSQIANWAAEFCYGMGHAAQCGMISHRDIKPENLLIGRFNGLQITDFGIASAKPLEWPKSRQPNEVMQANAVSGTPVYMAPEQWRGERQDFGTDVYAFGIVLHELCFGRLPWAARSIAELRTAHFSGSRSVSAHPLKEIIARAIAIDSRERFSSPDELLASIEAVARKEGFRLTPRPEPRNEDRDELLAKASLSATDNQDHAMAAAQVLTERWPSFGAGWTQLGRLWLEQNELDKALEATQRSLNVDGTRSAPWNNLGLALERLGRHEEAIKAFQCALDCDAQNTGAMSNLGGLLSFLGRNSEAVKLFERALQIAPDKGNIWFNLGSTYHLLGNTRRATDCFQNAITKAPVAERAAWTEIIRRYQSPPDDPPEQVVDVGKWVQQGRFNDAMPLLLEASENDPDNPAIWHNLALAYRGQNMVPEARTALLRVIKLEPKNPFAIVEIMRLAQCESEWTEAHKWCDEFARLPGRLFESMALRARILADSGDMKAARQLLFQAIREHPNQVGLFVAFGDLALEAGAPAAAASKGYGPALQLLARRKESDVGGEIRRKYALAVEAAKKDLDDFERANAPDM